MQEISPRSVDILPKGGKNSTFGQLIGFFYEPDFEPEVRFGRFRVDFYSKSMKLAFEYDGIHHYSVIQKIESDKRKNDLMKSEGIKLVRWPFYFMPTQDTCKHIFQDHYSDKKFLLMLKNLFGALNETEMYSPGFHSTPNIPANFLWPGIDKFLTELYNAPESIRHQVRHSLKLYCQVRADNNYEIVIPTHHEKFMEFFKGHDDESYLGFYSKNES